ncbi:MAG: hypothetical protein WC960_05545 [Bacteroidales bacterium]
MKKIAALLALLLLLSISPLRAQNAILEHPEIDRANQLKLQYHFVPALQLYREILSKSNDSTIIHQLELSIIECENGRNMLKYSTPLTPAGSTKIAGENFFLYLPPLQKWCPLPDSISSDTNRYLTTNIALIEPSKGDRLYYSALNDSGNWDIFVIEQIEGTLWNHPEPVAAINSLGNELFPILSQDGKRLYFSSNGHFGMGGYDLYMSQWNEELKEWDSPQNLGFPYSSTSNDLLFFDSACGQYSYLVSDRNSPPNSDSLTLFRVKLEVNPIKKEVGSAEEAIEIASLNPLLQSDKELSSPGKILLDNHTDHYTQALMESKKIKSRIDSLTTVIGEERGRYGHLSSQTEQLSLENRILELELQLIELNGLLHTSNKIIQAKEMEFLSKGILIPREEVTVKVPDSKKDRELDSYTIEIKKGELLPFPQIEFPPPPPEPVDYPLTIEKVSTFAPEQELPMRLVYRIQLMVLSAPFKNIATFKGLTPLFTLHPREGRYIYSVGQFSKYEHAASALQSVKRRGFASAIITPFYEGESLSIKEARKLEEEIEAGFAYQIKCESYPAGMPRAVIEFLKSRTEKDIIKNIVAERNIYFIGPYKNRDEAVAILELLNSLGGERNSIDKIKLK